MVAIFASRIPVDAAVIYKWTDADGVVHFSDQAVPGAEKILTSSGSSARSGAGSRRLEHDRLGRRSRSLLR